MTKFKVKLWLCISFLGLLGVVSLLASEIPLPDLPKQMTDRFSPTQIQFLILINPAILIILFSLLGTILYDKVKLRVPILEVSLNNGEKIPYSLRDIFRFGLFMGVVAGLLIMGIARIFDPYLPDAFQEATKGPSLSILSRVLYGGIAEEIMMRFGLMSFFIWLIYKISKKLNNSAYWFGIILSSIVFAFGHFPILFQTVSDPGAFLYAYIILGNSVGGLIFGYVYFKKGLESAMIAHAMAHVTMLGIERVF